MDRQSSGMSVHRGTIVRNVGSLSWDRFEESLGLDKSLGQIRQIRNSMCGGFHYVMPFSGFDLAGFDLAGIDLAGIESTQLLTKLLEISVTGPEFDKSPADARPPNVGSYFVWLDAIRREFRSSSQDKFKIRFVGMKNRLLLRNSTN